MDRVGMGIRSDTRSALSCNAASSVVAHTCAQALDACCQPVKPPIASPMQNYSKSLVGETEARETPLCKLCSFASVQ